MSTAETTAIIALVDDHVRGAAQLLLTLAATPRFGEWYGRAVQRASLDGRYPRIAELVAAGAFTDSGDATWNPFEFGLERVLDGIVGDNRTPEEAPSRHQLHGSALRQILFF